jgi:two-component system LytT family response regulator
MNCLIVDDNQIELAAARQLVNMDPSLNLVGVCKNALDAYQKHLDQPVDLLILDIEMPDISGIELVQSLDGKRPMIIFMTSGLEYAAQAFDLNVVDFITKPIAPIRFLQAIAKAKELKKAQDLLLKSEDDGFIFIRDSNVIRKVKLDDILYLEAMGDHVNLFKQHYLQYPFYYEVSRAKTKSARLS